MKKLMTVIGAAVAAFGLYADDLFVPAATSAEEGEMYEVDQSVFDADSSFWYMDETADDAAVVKAYEGEGPAHTELYKKSKYPETDQLQYIALDADAPVYRTFAAVDLTPAQVAIADAGAERGGIIVDQLVKFSAYDENPTDLGDAKIAVWVKAVDADDTQDGSTNLMITCGNLDIMLTPDTDEPAKTITAGSIDDLDKFYRLTITAIEAGTANSKVIPGFKVALDGVDIALAEGLFPADPSLGGGVYSAEGADLIKANKLFPSLIAYNGEATLNPNTLQGVAYKGTGAIDDITVAAKGLYNIEVVIVPPTGAEFGTLVNAEPVAGKDNTYSVTPGATVSGTLVANGPYVVKKTDFEFENVSKDTEFTFDDDAVVEAVAQIGDVYYAPLADAFAAATTGDKIEMVAATAAITNAIKIQGKTLTLTGESVITANGRAFDLYAGANLTIDEDITLNGTGATTPIFLWPYVSKVSANPDSAEYAKATLTVDGTVTYSGTGKMAAITSNGYDRDGGVDVIINGTVTNTKDAALYLPGKGTLTVNDGANIEGTFAGVQMKSVAMTVNGGTIKATGEDLTPTDLYSNGANASGCAIQMEGNTAYAGGISLVVKGGVIESTNAKAIYAYGAQEKFSTISIEGGIIKGNTGVFLLDEGMDKAIVPGTSKAQFNQDVSDFCEEGFETVKLDGADYYTVQAIQPEPETFTVTFSTNTVTVAEKTLTDVESGTVLEAKDVPDDFGEGTWDVQPLGAIITCDTNFNFTVKAEENWDVDPADEDKPASQVWTKVPQNLADVPAGRLSTWAKANNVPFGGDFTETMEEAYLLNCAPDKVAETKTQINIASIEFVDNEWVIKTVSGDQDGDEFGNGELELVDVTKDVTGAEGSDAAKLWKMKLVPITANEPVQDNGKQFH